MTHSQKKAMWQQEFGIGEFEDGGKDHESRMYEASGSWKKQGSRFFSQPPTQTQFEFSPVHPCCASQLQNPKMITSCCLKPQSIVIRNSCRKHTHSLASWEYSFFPHHKAGFSQGEGAYLSHFHTLGLCHKVNARNTLWGFLKWMHKWMNHTHSAKCTITDIFFGLFNFLNILNVLLQYITCLERSAHVISGQWWIFTQCTHLAHQDPAQGTEHYHSLQKVPSCSFPLTIHTARVSTLATSATKCFFFK